jgi:hypothetical protein
VLRGRQFGFLAARVDAGMPGGYLSVSQFARHHGRSSAEIARLTRRLAKFKIKSSVHLAGTGRPPGRRRPR